VTHDSMPYDPIQGQSHGGLKFTCTKMANFKVNLRRYACSQKNYGELWYSRAISKC